MMECLTLWLAGIGGMMARAGAVRPCLQFKMTALLPADLVARLAGLVAEHGMAGLARQVAAGLQTGRRVELPGLSAEQQQQLDTGLVRLAKEGLVGHDQQTVFFNDLKWLLF